MTLDETFDLSNTCLRLRQGLEFEIRESSRDAHCVIHDGLTGDYYEVGLPEYGIISLLDGRTRLCDVVSQSASHLGDNAIDQQEAISIFHWLVKTGLAEPVDGSTQSAGLINRIRTRTAQKQKSTRLARWNLMFMKIPLGDPQNFLQWITPRFSWLTGPTFFYVWLVVCVFAITCLFLRWDTLAASASSVIDSDSWRWMIVSIVLLKAVHEIAHGIFCFRHGGRVKEAGIVFILFIPMPYMDVTSCWGFASKWKRLMVSAAGMYIESFLAAAATIAWFFATDPTKQFHLFNVMLVGGVSTLLFNANFLMRFDGYYIFSDICDIPNLYARSQQCLAASAKRLMLGIATEAVRESRLKRTIIVAYAVAALLWRVIVCGTLAIAASQLLYGFGLVLALFAVTIWCAIPAANLLRYLFCSEMMQHQQWMRLTYSSTLAVSACLVTCVYVPWPQRVSAPAIVVHADPWVVRAETAGFLTDIRVRSGDHVRSGDVIAVLRNDPLMARHATFLLDHEESLVRGRGYFNAREIAPYQAELAARQSIEAELSEAQREIDALIIRAPRAGTIHGYELESRLGCYLHPGETFVEIVDDAKKEILLAIDQHDVDSFSSRDQKVSFLGAAAMSLAQGRFRNVDPTASTQIDERLTASAGGPLSLRVKQTPSSEPDTMAMELVHPRFKGWVDLNASQSITLRAGATGYVSLDRYSHSVGSHLKRLASQWFRSRTESAQRR